MIKLYFGILFSLSLLFGFSDPIHIQANCEKEGEIIEFESLKCGGCWGWIIAVGNDTIKTDDSPKLEEFGYRFKEPKKIYITIGSARNEFSRNYPYHEIICIEERIKAK